MAEISFSTALWVITLVYKLECVLRIIKYKWPEPRNACHKSETDALQCIITEKDKKITELKKDLDSRSKHNTLEMIESTTNGIPQDVLNELKRNGTMEVIAKRVVEVCKMNGTLEAIAQERGGKD